MDQKLETPPPDLNEINTHRYALSSDITSTLYYVADAVLVLAFGLVFHQVVNGTLVIQEPVYQFSIFFLCFCVIVLLRYGGVYNFNSILDPVKIFHRIIIAGISSFLLLFAILFSLKMSDQISRLWVLYYAGSIIFTLSAYRLVSFFVIAKLASRKVIGRNVLIIGCNDQSLQLIKKFKNVRPSLNNIIGIFDDRKDRVEAEQDGVPVLGDLNDLVHYVRTHNINDIIITLPWNADKRLMNIIGKLRELPVHIYLGADLVTFCFPYRPSPHHFVGVPMMEVISAPLSGWNAVIKSLEDKILGSLIVLAFAPVLLIVAIAIKLESPGPVIFKQKRLGYNNREFMIYKFRSMYHKKIPDKVTKQATKDDPRITKVGRFIRKTSLDELPQLFNVLNGTMSLVGPRPHALDHNDEYSKLISGYFSRHRVKPGITGWSQVHGLRGETDTIDKMEARVNYDTYYAENWSIQLDFQILVMTAFVGFVNKNAY